jgi:hypothetical protein
MSVSTEHQRAVRVLYCNLMFEVRHRIDFLLRLQEEQYNLPQQPACELGYLQIRMICETIALACLAVHGEVPGARTAKIRGAHEADKILNSLGGLHPNFYPQPGTRSPHPNGGNVFTPTTAEYMTKPELVRLYWECGDWLHRGNFEDAKNFQWADFEPIATATLKIIELLRFHKISFLGTNDEMWVYLTDPATGNVRATLERPFRN